jgi:hypothetical protein
MEGAYLAQNFVETQRIIIYSNTYCFVIRHHAIVYRGGSGSNLVGVQITGDRDSG